MYIDRRQSDRGNGNGKMPMMESGKRKNMPTRKQKNSNIVHTSKKIKKDTTLQCFEKRQNYKIPQTIKKLPNSNKKNDMEHKQLRIEVTAKLYALNNCKSVISSDYISTNSDESKINTKSYLKETPSPQVTT